MASTIKSLFFDLKNNLNKIYNDGESTAISYRLLEEIFDMNHSDFILNNERNATADEVLVWEKLKAELLNGRPLQYVLGYTYFSNLRFKVDESVLIPRPETEELVNHVVNYVRQQERKAEKLNIIDIGTGSGCIAIALKNALPEAIVSGVDNSEDALKLARQNAVLNNVDVAFYHKDILNETWEFSDKKFDIIVSNPPYITITERESLEKNVIDFEPHQALFVTNNDPLQFYRKIKNIAENHLETSGCLFFELHEDYAKNVQEMMIEAHWEASILKDFFGKERFLIANR